MPRLAGAAWQAAHPTETRRSGPGPQRYAIGDRFISKVRVGKSHDECWEWLAGVSHRYAGYGVMGGSGGQRSLLAHRASWMIFRGPIPPGMDILHSCDNRLCTNPRHLSLGTQGDNNADRHRKGRDGSTRGRPQHRLTSDQIAKIRTPGASAYRLAREFGFTYRAIRAVQTGAAYRNWP